MAKLGNASLLDVFQAGTHVANQALDIYSREKKYELDAVYLQEELSLKQLMNQMVADYKKIDMNSPDGSNAYQNNPQMYRDYINKTIGQWRDNALKAGNNSQYYNDLINRTQLTAREKMEELAYTAEVDAGNQRANIALDKAYWAVMQDAAMNPEEKLNTILALGEKFSALNGFSPEKKYEWTTNAYNDFLNYYASNNIQPTTAQDRQYLESLKGLLPQDMPGRDADLAKAEGVRRSQIWTVNKDEMLQADAIYQTLIRESVREGNVYNPPKYYEAMALRTKWLPVRDGMSGNTEFAEDDKDQLAKTFEEPWIKGVAAGPAGSRKGARAPRMQEYYMMMVVSGNESLEAMLDAYMGALTQWTNDNGISLDDYLYSNEYLEDTRGFMQEAVKQSFNQYEALTGMKVEGEKGVMMKAVDNALGLLKGVPKDRIESANAYLIQAASNLFQDYGNGVYLDTGDQSLQKRLNGLVEGLIVSKAFSGKQPELKSDKDKYAFIKNLEEHGDILAMRIRLGLSVENRNGRVVLTPGSEIMAGGASHWNETYKVFAADAAQILGVTPGQVAFSNTRQTEGGDKNEVSAMPTFTVAAGTKNAKGQDVGGTYRFATEGDKLVLKRAGGGTVSSSSANELREQESQAQKTQTRRLSAERDLRQWRTTAIGRVKNGQTAFTMADQSTINKFNQAMGNGTISRIDMLKQGMETVSSPILDAGMKGAEDQQLRVLRGVPESQRKDVVAGWRAAGVRITQRAVDFADPKERGRGR
ncbi:MAG: hypothetical protein LBC31_06935 [Treponema sp.]|jgi:hypothetical protein|nr:hypothetical protein [Treponema sp.]